MSGKGWVTTSRGEGLNIDDLIAKSKRPLGVKEEKSEIKKRVVPGAGRQLNIRGFQPAQGESKPPEIKNEKAATEELPVAAYRDGKKAESTADITGVKVKKRPSTKKPSGSAEEAANAVLGDITSGLEAAAPNAIKAAEQEAKKPTRRRSK